MHETGAVSVRKLTESGLTTKELGGFIEQGFVAVRGAFPRTVADQARERLWKMMNLDPQTPTGWNEPVVRLPGSSAEPFVAAANSARLHRCFDQLVGSGNWVPPKGLGAFRIRFPTVAKPDDLGWHCDAGFGEWPYRINVHSRGRGLLMLFLLSDVGADDAPTRLRVGSHHIVPSLLAPAGEAGLTVDELADRLRIADSCPVAEATGSAGDVYLCHPFLVHAAQPHRGERPRFMAQPRLRSAEPICAERDDGSYTPVERAIRQGLGYE